MKNRWTTRTIIALGLLGAFTSPETAETPPDPHYTEGGFFDVHVCNWADRNPFFKVLFSTFDYDQVESVQVSFPDGTPMIALGLVNFIEFEQKGRKKRAYMEELDAPASIPNGWYRAKIRFKDGRSFAAKDFVDTTNGLLPLAHNPSPEPGAKEVALPLDLSWAPVPGASHYQVYLRDLWDRKLVFRSELVTTTRLRIPDKGLEPGGLYEWLVHARDVNEDPVLGDFNLGSQTAHFVFEVAD